MTLTAQQSIDQPTKVRKLTVDEYHQMIASGVLEEGEPYELLGGQLIQRDRSETGGDPMTIGHDHAAVVRRLARLSIRLQPLGCFMQVQQPITLAPFDEPEPDGAIIIGTEEDFDRRHPGPADVRCVIEVADASLKRDRGLKQQIYAAAGIPQYLIVNLPDRCVEVYTNPLPDPSTQQRYGRLMTLTPDETIELEPVPGQHVHIKVSDLLPT